jgi:single-stranded-DNA-specific exonuclease
MPYHPVKKKIIRRPLTGLNGSFSNLPSLLQRIYASRKVAAAAELDRSLNQLPAPWLLSGMEAMADLLADAVKHGRSLMVIGDYDADGATASAVAVRGLRALGLERVSYLVPNRFEYGYGLTPEIVALAARQKPDILLTVDNGISSLDGVAAAKALGMQVLVTDHHLPGAELPEADAIVNPNLRGDAFPSKSLAGVGVMFYVLMALRHRLRIAGRFARSGASEPNLGQLLDLVALGTVADVVNLDHVNRILVHQGLQRIRSEQAHPGILTLMEVAGRKPRQATAADLGFFVGPRLNAAGRLDDMTLGIECLLSDSPDSARAMAARLNELNRDRRHIEEQMKLDALRYLEGLEDSAQTRPALCLFEEDWHQGVVGLVASRIKDRVHRPVIAFAPAGEDSAEIKGSARSIPGVHIRDVLADIATRHPGLLKKFGGHAMAAGLSLARDKLDEFALAFETEVESHLANLDLEHAVHTDGALEAHEMDLAMAEMLRQAGPWGQGFPEPLFDGEFDVAGSRIVGERHLKLVLKPPRTDRLFDAIAFGVDNPTEWLACRTLLTAYRLDVNEFRDARNVQLRIEYMESGEF